MKQNGPQHQPNRQNRRGRVRKFQRERMGGERGENRSPTQETFLKIYALKRLEQATFNVCLQVLWKPSPIVLNRAQRKVR